MDVKGIRWSLAHNECGVLKEEKLRLKEVNRPVPHQPAQQGRVESEWDLKKSFKMSSSNQEVKLLLAMVYLLGEVLYPRRLHHYRLCSTLPKPGAPPGPGVSEGRVRCTRPRCDCSSHSCQDLMVSGTQAEWPAGFSGGAGEGRPREAPLLCFWVPPLQAVSIQSLILSCALIQ